MHKTIIGAIVAVLVVGGGAFYAGMTYAKSQSPTRGQFGPGATFALRTGAGGRTGGLTAGQIITSSNGSITVQLQSGSTQIVLLGTSTQVFKTAQGSLSDLSQGVNVVVTGTPNSDGSLTAQSIQIRPAGMNGGFGGRGAVPQ